MNDHSRYLTWHAIGLRDNPWTVHIQTNDGTRAHDLLEMAVRDKGFVVIAGDCGSGKTEAIERALPPSAQRVETVSLDKERLKVGDIEEALIADLTDERPRRSREARSRQLRGILGEASALGPVVLIIEDAHFLHANTVRALKRLRELKFAGRSQMLTVVLIAQRDPTQGIKEVHLRSDTFHMQGLSVGEARDYLSRAIGAFIEPAAITALTEARTARNFLDLQEAANYAMATAVSVGHRQVTLMDVLQSSGGGLRQVAEAAGIGPSEIAQAVKKSPSHVTRVLSGERQDADTEDTIRDYLLQRRGLAGNGEQAPVTTASGASR